MSEPNDAAKEIASYIKHRVRGTTLGVHLEQYSDGEQHIANAIQEMIDNGHIYGGYVITGDHEVDNRTVLDWSELGGKPKWQQISTMERNVQRRGTDADPL